MSEAGGQSFCRYARLSRSVVKKTNSRVIAAITPKPMSGFSANRSLWKMGGAQSFSPAALPNTAMPQALGVM